MDRITKFPLLDETGQEIVNSLEEINNSMGDYIASNNPYYAYLEDRKIGTLVSTEITKVRYRALYKRESLISIDLPKCTTVDECAFENCTSLENVNLPECTTVDMSAFSHCEKLQNVNIPKCTIINQAAFSNCTALESIDLPKCTTVGDFAFNNCEKLSNVNLPECEGVGTRSFLRCTALSKIIFQKIERMAAEAFEDCSNLETLIIKNDTRVCSMYRQGTTDALSGTKIESGNGYIYVPDKLVQQYKREYNWVKYANQIKPLSEYTE